MTEKELELIKQAQREYWRQYREKNREKINATERAWRAKNPDKKAAIDKRYRENHPDRVKATQQRYWLKKAGLLPDQTPPQKPTEAPQVDVYACQYCGTSFAPKRSDAKFCGTSCRVMNNRKVKRNSR